MEKKEMKKKVVKKNINNKKNKLETYKRPHTIMTFSKSKAYGVLDESLLQIGNDPSALTSSFYEAVTTSNNDLLHYLMIRCFFAGANRYRKEPELFNVVEKKDFNYDSTEFSIYPDNDDKEENMTMNSIVG